MANETLTALQAYKAMYRFLAQLQARTDSDELAMLLGEMGLLADGGTADPAAWQEWTECVAQSLGDEVDTALRLMPPFGPGR